MVLWGFTLIASFLFVLLYVIVAGNVCVNKIPNSFLWVVISVYTCREKQVLMSYPDIPGGVGVIFFYINDCTYSIILSTKTTAEAICTIVKPAGIYRWWLFFFPVYLYN
jgi:hypothetical protein